MKVINVQQGSKEWAEVRAKHFTASEASAMMGASKYQTRNELLQQKATGLTPDVSLAQQRLFNLGHAAEAGARPLAEAIIAEEIYPVTAVSDDHDFLLASFDGITVMDDVIWEHKLYGKALAAQIELGVLDPHYYWQLEQQLLVSNADRCLFMCSDGTAENCVHMWYEAVPGRAEQLLAGWKQFNEDLATHQPTEAKAAPTAAPVLDLPAVSVQVSGELAIADNFGAFETALRDFIEHRLIIKPQTDQDFADLESQIKTLKKAEGALDAAEAQLLSQVATVDQLKRTKDLLHKLARDNRLAAEKLVKSEKEARRLEILQAAKQALNKHVGSAEARIEQAFGNQYPVRAPALPADFAGAMKGKRTISSLQSAADDELARAKIEVNAWADNATTNLRTLDDLASEHRFLFNDLQVIIAQPNDHFELILKSRIADHEKAETERREREEAQMRERLEREQAAKLEADRERIRQEEAAKLEAQHKADAAKAQAVTAAIACRPDEEIAYEQLVPVNGIREPRFTQPTGRRPIVREADGSIAETHITISKAEYDELQAESRMLAALMAAGVDQWSGYDEARESLGLTEIVDHPF